MGLAEKGGPSWAVPAKLDDGFSPSSCSLNTALSLCPSVSPLVGKGWSLGMVMCLPFLGSEFSPSQDLLESLLSQLDLWAGLGLPWSTASPHLTLLSHLLHSSILSCHLSESLALLLGGQGPRVRKC